MKYSKLYSLNEKFSGTFSPRDFGDAMPTIVDMPDYIEPGSKIETYVHDYSLLFTFVFDSNNTPTYFIQGTLKNPIDVVREVLTDKDLEQISREHPSDPRAHSEYSGVEPIRPPFKGYDGPYHIPKEFNMKKFNEYGSFAGIRSPKGWTLN